MTRYFIRFFSSIIGVWIGLFLISAHATGLKSSVPYIHQDLQAGKQEIHLIYTDSFDPFRSRLLLIDSSGQPILIPATATLNHREVKAIYIFKKGNYVLEWHIWSWKGKETSGRIPFRVIDSMSSHSIANFKPAPATKGQQERENKKQAVSN